MYSVYSYKYVYDEGGNFHCCEENSRTNCGSFDLSLGDLTKTQEAMGKLGSDNDVKKYLHKTHLRYYAIDENLCVPDGSDYDIWSFIVSNSHINLGYKF